MMDRLKYLSVLLLFVLAFTACGDSDELPPTVTISQPGMVRPLPYPTQ